MRTLLLALLIAGQAPAQLHPFPGPGVSGAAGGGPDITSTWLFDEGMGTTAGDSVGSNDLTSSGSFSWTSYGVDLTGGFFEVATPALEADLLNEDFSVCTAVNFDTTGAARGVLTKSDTGSPFVGYILRANSSDFEFWAIADYPSTRFLQMTSNGWTLSTGTWHHICVTATAGMASSGVQVYLNGALQSMTVNNNTYAGPEPASPANFNIGTEDSESSSRLVDGKYSRTSILLGGTKWDAAGVLAECALAETQLEGAGETPAWGCN